MTLICFSSQKGSPGATATALAVAASLKVAKGRRKVLLEADATGGTLAIRYQMPVEPGLLTLAAAVRGGLDSSEGLWRHTQELPGGLPVIVCPDGPEQVHAAMAAGGAQLGRFLNNLRDVDVMCDVGRLAPDSPALPFVAEASAVLMVARPTAEQLQPAARRMLMLRPYVANLGWVLVGQKPYGPADVESTYEFPVVGVMADDPRSVTSLERGTVSKRLRRQPFIRSATTLADTLSNWLAPLTALDDSPVTAPTASTSPAEVAPDTRPESAPVPAGMPDEVVARNGYGAPAVGTAVVGDPPGSPVDLSLLPPPTGEPDPSTPHPEPPRLISAPLHEPPDDDLPEPNPVDDPDAETTVFSSNPELLDLPPPPPPAPVGERPVSEPTMEPFGDLEVPNGVTWSDIGLDGGDEPEPPEDEAEPPEGDAEPVVDLREPDSQAPDIEVGAVPPVPPPSLALPPDDEVDSWDGAEFTITADLDKVFRPPDFDAAPIGQDREVPPMPPIPSVPPLPPPSTQLAPGLNGDHSPPPSPFPHEDTDPEGTEW